MGSNLAAMFYGHIQLGFFQIPHSGFQLMEPGQEFLIVQYLRAVLSEFRNFEFSQVWNSLIQLSGVKQAWWFHSTVTLKPRFIYQNYGQCKYVIIEQRKIYFLGRSRCRCWIWYCFWPISSWKQVELFLWWWLVKNKNKFRISEIDLPRKTVFLFSILYICMDHGFDAGIWVSRLFTIIIYLLFCAYLLLLIILH